MILHNRVTGFRDGISLLEDEEAVDQFSIDILNNDLIGNGDDGVEADFCFHNCRTVGNRLTNNFIALSSQPSLGGPTYFVRNVVYNAVHLAFKLYRGSTGDVLLHNTVVKNGDALGIIPSRPVARLHTRNNLFIGGPGASLTCERIAVMKRPAGHVRGGPPSPSLRRSGHDRRSGGSGRWRTSASTCISGTARCASWARVERWCWSSGCARNGSGWGSY